MVKFKKFLKAVVWGLIAALLLVLTVPSITNGSVSLSYVLNRLVGPASYHDAVAKSAPAVVNIYTKSMTVDEKTGEMTLLPDSLGSGVIMTSQGHILTNYHVIQGAQKIIVALQDGRLFESSLIGMDKLTDLAVLKIEDDNLPVIPQNPKRVSKVGDVVLAIGNPFNVGQTVTMGIIGAKGRSGLGTMGPNSNGRQDLLQTDAYVGVGNSGGALVNTLGELVGINSGTYSTAAGQDTSNITFAVPYALAHRIMNDLIKNGRVIRGYLGIKTVDVDAVTANLLNLGPNHGLIVQGVDPTGPASKGGLEVGDIMLTLEGVKITNAQMAMDIIAETKPGTLINIDVLRSGTSRSLQVTVAEDLLH